ncbi:MAG: Rieske 2Fe-2S domain-containing protein, partial [Vicinamibacterales bacterium]
TLVACGVVMAEPPQEAGSSPLDVLVEVERLIAELQRDHGVIVRDRVTQLLEDIDAVHRAGLTHLVSAIRGMGGDAFVNRLIADPAIRLLLTSYELIPADRRLIAEEALDPVRGHLHAHGIDVEIVEVVGGVVYVKLHGLGSPGLAEASVVQDLERALEVGFIGFQELVTRERQRSAAATTISLGSLKRAHRPVYRDLLEAETLSDGATRAFDIDGLPVLLARVGPDYYAVGNRCGDTPLPLEFSPLAGPELICSWHHCRYDLRTGARLDGAGERLRVFPVKVDDGRVRIAVDVESAIGHAP